MKHWSPLLWWEGGGWLKNRNRMKSKYLILSQVPQAWGQPQPHEVNLQVHRVERFQMPWTGRSPSPRQYPGVWDTAQPWATTSGGTCQVSSFNKIFYIQCSGSGSTMRGILWWIRIRILGSMPQTNGSGFGSGLGSGSASSYFRHWPWRWHQKNSYFSTFSHFYSLKLYLHHLWNIKSKDFQKMMTQGFCYYFWMMLEGSVRGCRAGSGSISLTSGSGSGMPKNMWIRIRIRICNISF